MAMKPLKTGDTGSVDRYTVNSTDGVCWSAMMDYQDDEEQTAIRDRLEELRVEHRDLDDVIDRLVHDPDLDQIRLSRMKKRKLLLKDMMAKLESRLIPDLNA